MSEIEERKYAALKEKHKKIWLKLCASLWKLNSEHAGMDERKQQLSTKYPSLTEVEINFLLFYSHGWDK